MSNKRDIRIFIVPIIVFFVFLFGIIGYAQSSEFSLSTAVYRILFFFILNNINSADIGNNWLLVSRYLAAVLLGFGVYSLLYKHLSVQFTRLKIKNNFHNHVVVFSMKMVGASFFSDLRANNYQVVLVESNAENPFLEKIEKGVVILRGDEHGTKLFDTLLIAHATACVIAFDDDNVNIELSLKVLKYLRSKGRKHSVRVLTHIGKNSNLAMIQDHIDISNADENFEFEVFNISSAASKKIYDHYPPHNYFKFDNQDEENAIAIVGYNHAAEDFIIENIILSHYKDGKNIKIYLVEKDADHVLNQFMYNYPFCREFIDIVPVKLLNSKFFANFNWSKELIEKLSKVKSAYFFGDDGAELVNLAARFRQFLAGQIANYLNAPIVLCYPEDTSIMNLLDVERESNETLTDELKKQLNIDFVYMISDTCTSSRLLEESEYIDMLSRVINYYYSIKYEFEWVLKEKWHIADVATTIKAIEKKLLELSEKHAQLTEHEIEGVVLKDISALTKASVKELKPIFGIKRWWERLSYHKKSSNRYAARHMAVKLNVMKNIGCMPLTHENILHSFPVIAPIEHKRWCAEKMVLNYRYGILPEGRAAKNNVKERLKIHDQLIPYEKLKDTEKEKDLNIFLLMPLLNSLKVEIKK